MNRKSENGVMRSFWKLHQEIQAMPKGRDKSAASEGMNMNLLDLFIMNPLVMSQITGKNLLRFALLCKTYNINGKSFFDAMVKTARDIEEKTV